LDLLGWWPWTMPMDSLPFGIDHVTPSLIVSPLAFAIIAVLAGWQLSRREVVL
jgi:cytochrome oxidase assembly protein ShyY1